MVMIAFNFNFLHSGVYKINTEGSCQASTGFRLLKHFGYGLIVDEAAFSVVQCEWTRYRGRADTPQSYPPVQKSSQCYFIHWPWKVEGQHWSQQGLNSDHRQSEQTQITQGIPINTLTTLITFSCRANAKEKLNYRTSLTYVFSFKHFHSDYFFSNENSVCFAILTLIRWMQNV